MSMNDNAFACVPCSNSFGDFANQMQNDFRSFRLDPWMNLVDQPFQGFLVRVVGVASDEVHPCGFLEATCFSADIMDVGQEPDVAVRQFGLQHFQLRLADHQRCIAGLDQGDFTLSCPDRLALQLRVLPQMCGTLLADMMQVDSIKDDVSNAVVTDQSDVRCRDIVPAEQSSTNPMAVDVQPLIESGTTGNADQLYADGIQETLVPGADNPVVWHEDRAPSQLADELQDPAHSYRAGIAGWIRDVGVQYEHVSGPGRKRGMAASIRSARVIGWRSNRSCS